MDNDNIIMWNQSTIMLALMPLLALHERDPIITEIMKRLTARITITEAIVQATVAQQEEF